MAGWHHQLDGSEFEWTPGVDDRQGGLACCDSWGRKESDTTEQLNGTEESLKLLGQEHNGRKILHIIHLLRKFSPKLSYLRMPALSLSRVWLCDPRDCSTPGSSVHGIFQARILEWVAISSFRGSSWITDQTRVSCISCIGRCVFYHWSTCEALYLRTSIYKIMKCLCVLFIL